jgi:hypothetical protein
MPFAQDPGQREHDSYCSYCYSNGQLHGANLTLKEFKAMSYKNMRSHGTNPLAARFFTFMIGFAPYWKQHR